MKTNKNNRWPVLTGTLSIFVAAMLLFSAPSVKAQAPAIVGIDHVGINVPDLDEGIKFFHDMFGFNAVTKLGPIPMDANWKKSFHIHDNAGQVTIVMMRAGDGSNIEIFGYKPGAGSTEQPFRDDISATHFSLYTSDIKATKAYLESKGVKFLSDIIPGGGDTEGESWVYFETPWGSTIELNSYPAGKGYEKKHPAVKLWTASSQMDFNTAAIASADIEALKTRQMAVWNDGDPADRLEKMKVIYQDNVIFADHDGEISGLVQLNERITNLQKSNPGFKFTPIKADNIGNRVRIYWNFGPATNPKLISGMDLIILENGKIRSLDAFLDHLPSPAKK